MIREVRWECDLCGVQEVAPCGMPGSWGSVSIVLNFGTVGLPPARRHIEHCCGPCQRGVRARVVALLQEIKAEEGAEPQPDRAENPDLCL